MPRPKKIDENEEITIFEEPETVVQAEIVEPVSVQVPETTEPSSPKGIKDIEGLTDEQKQVLIDSGIAKILEKMPNSGYTVVQYTASEGYPRNQAGILRVSAALLEELREFYITNVGPVSGESLVAFICTKLGQQIFTKYPNLTIVNLG